MNLNLNEKEEIGTEYSQMFNIKKQLEINSKGNKNRTDIPSERSLSWGKIRCADVSSEERKQTR